MTRLENRICNEYEFCVFEGEKIVENRAKLHCNITGLIKPEKLILTYNSMQHCFVWMVLLLQLTTKWRFSSPNQQLEKWSQIFLEKGPSWIEILSNNGAHYHNEELMITISQWFGYNIDKIIDFPWTWWSQDYSWFSSHSGKYILLFLFKL